MTRRFFGAVVTLACVWLLSSCSLLPPPSGSFRDSSDQLADIQMQRIEDSVKNHDVAALKSLFSTSARQKAGGLDGRLAYFLSFFPSGQMTWKSQGAGLSGINKLYMHATELFGNYKISANGNTYSLYFAYFSVNDFHPDEVGIYALGVVPEADDGYTASGAKKPFDVWASQFGIDENTNEATGDPGIYVPQD